MVGRQNIRFIIILFTTVLLFTPELFSERIRGTVHEVYSVSEKEDTSGSLKIHQLVAIDLTASPFIKGLEIRLSVPSSVMEFRESFLFRIFSDLSPRPSTELRQYSGNETLSKAFPIGKTLFISIPISGGDMWKPSGVGLTIIDPPLSMDEFPLLLTIDPVMKGIPGNVSSAPFEFTVSPVLRDLGTLSLILPDNFDSSDLLIKIDGDTYPPGKKSYIVATGVHELEISSPLTVPYKTTFGIEQAERTEVRVDLEPAMVSVDFEAPEEAQIFFDGKLVSPEDFESFRAEPGEHVVLVQLGDYSLSKKLRFNGGETYKVSLFFDILVNER